MVRIKNRSARLGQLNVNDDGGGRSEESVRRPTNETRTGFDGVSSAEGIRRLKLRSESSSTFNESVLRDSRASSICLVGIEEESRAGGGGGPAVEVHTI